MLKVSNLRTIQLIPSGIFKKVPRSTYSKQMIVSNTVLKIHII